MSVVISWLKIKKETIHITGIVKNEINYDAGDELQHYLPKINITL